MFLIVLSNLLVEYLGSLSMYRNDDDDNLVIIMVLDCKLGGIHLHIQR